MLLCMISIKFEGILSYTGNLDKANKKENKTKKLLSRFVLK